MQPLPLAPHARPTSRRSLGVLAILFGPLVACYTQHALTAPTPAAGTHIVAELTDSGTVIMANQLGPGVTEVEGVFAQSDGANWKLLMTRVEQRGVGSTFWNREPVSFPRIALTRVTDRQLDKKRSWIAAGIIAAAAIIAARAFGAFNFISEGGSESTSTK
ncbi:MAG TPA: hypothetical protein VJO33_10735 [Gemmatimonadaceae bacterium]|nr:hypothetical protein [Gemmatimonadaceae bacterium]